MPAAEAKLFNKYKSALISELGRGPQDTASINSVGKREFGSSWGGCHPQDKVTLRANKCYVINTDIASGPGEHWIGLYTTKKKAYVYDSYGRPVAGLVSHLIKTIEKNGFELGPTNLDRHMEQIGYSSAVCGQCALSFLCVVRDLGIKRARDI